MNHDKNETPIMEKHSNIYKVMEYVAFQENMSLMRNIFCVYFHQTWISHLFSSRLVVATSFTPHKS